MLFNICLQLSINIPARKKIYFYASFSVGLGVFFIVAANTASTGTGLQVSSQVQTFNALFFSLCYTGCAFHGSTANEHIKQVYVLLIII